MADTSTLRLVGQRGSVLIFAGIAGAAVLAWFSQWALGVLTLADALAYPALAVVGIVLASLVKADAGRMLQAQRLGVSAMALYLVVTQLSWLLEPPRTAYPLAMFAPWVMCAQLLIFISWPVRPALKRCALLLLVLTLPPLLAVLGQGAAANWALQNLPVTLNAAMAQLCFGAVMVGLSVQLGTLMQLAPDAAGPHLTAEDLVALGTAERERQRHAATAGERAKSSFLSVVSHEMRTPLTALQGGLDAALREDLSATQAAALDQARRSGEQLLHVLAQTLEYARLDDGAVTLDVLPVQVVDLARRALAVARSAARDSSLTVGFELQSPSLNGPGGWVLLDPARVGQVLDVLLSNALRFTQAGSVVLRLRLDPVPLPMLEFEVRDTGIGMELGGGPQGFDPFQPFSQAADPLRRSQGGLGLGLAIGQRLAQQMGGSLQITSQLGVGTRAVLSLPVQLATVSVGTMGLYAGGGDADPSEPEPDTIAWRRATPNPMHVSQRRELLQLLAEHDSAALAAWEGQREAWAGVLPLADLAQAERAIADIDFDSAWAVLSPHHERDLA